MAWTKCNFLPTGSVLAQMPIPEYELDVADGCRSEGCVVARTKNNSPRLSPSSLRSGGAGPRGRREVLPGPIEFNVTKDDSRLVAGGCYVDGLERGRGRALTRRGSFKQPEGHLSPSRDDPSSAVPGDPVENPVEESPKTEERPSPNLSERAVYQGFRWWRGKDLNLRPSGYEVTNAADVCSLLVPSSTCEQHLRSFVLPSTPLLCWLLREWRLEVGLEVAMQNGVPRDVVTLMRRCGRGDAGSSVPSPEGS